MRIKALTATHDVYDQAERNPKYHLGKIVFLPAPWYDKDSFYATVKVYLKRANGNADPFRYWDFQFKNGCVLSASYINKHTKTYRQMNFCKMTLPFYLAQIKKII